MSVVSQRNVISFEDVIDVHRIERRKPFYYYYSSHLVVHCYLSHVVVTAICSLPHDP
jgi:hypothetical protein